MWTPGRLLEIFPLLALFVLLACGPRRDPHPDAGGVRDFGIGELPALETGPGGISGKVCTDYDDLPITPVPVDLLLVLDRSASMGAAFGAATRYDVAARLLKELLPGYDERIRFGFQAFPARGACPAGYVRGCCAEPPAVAVASRAAAAIAPAIDQAAPVEGNSPTAEALRLARGYLRDLRDGVSGRYILLTTDGRPSCSGDGRLPAPAPPGEIGPACGDAAVEVDALVSEGVKVIVLGVGPELATGSDEAATCLGELARRGGLARPDGPPDYYTAEHPQALEASLRRIFGATVERACAFVLSRVPADRNQVQVYFDGRQIPRSRRDGWDFEPPEDRQRIVIFGESCRRLGRFQVGRVEVRYGCPPCPDEGTCP